LIHFLLFRISNINTLSGTEPLEEVVRVDGTPVPTTYPATRDALYALTMAECDTLLNYYGLLVPAGTLVAGKCKIIGSYIGVPKIGVL
jgi:hypothetical protein